MTDTITKTAFNEAITNATNAVKPLLLAAEAAAAAIPSSDDYTVATRSALTALHVELANQLAIADALAGSGTMHTDGGGTDKGDTP
jgi:hypothetical protein